MQKICENWGDETEKLADRVARMRANLTNSLRTATGQERETLLAVENLLLELESSSLDEATKSQTMAIFLSTLPQ